MNSIFRRVHTKRVPMIFNDDQRDAGCHFFKCSLNYRDQYTHKGLHIVTRLN